jgi:hypothetical protein
MPRAYSRNCLGHLNRILLRQLGGFFNCTFDNQPTIWQSSTLQRFCWFGPNMIEICQCIFLGWFRGIFDSGSSSTELLCAKTVPTASAGTVNSAGCIRYLFRTPLRYLPSRWCAGCVNTPWKFANSVISSRIDLPRVTIFTKYGRWELELPLLPT